MGATEGGFFCSQITEQETGRMPLTILQARRRLGLTQVELSKLAGINQRFISEIESCKRSPTVSQRMALTRALGPVQFLEGGLHMSAPNVPEMRWKDGKPDFSHLTANEAQGTILEQLQTLLRDDYDHVLDDEQGDFLEIKNLYPDNVLYELHSGGQSEIFRQSYMIQNGKALLGDDAERVPQEEFSILSRRRIARMGVPEMPTVDED
jgi:transcriptional regulator with XRE-family HTH domain